MSIWSERIKELSSGKHGLSSLAHDLGVPLSTLSELKAGRSKAPRYDLAVKLLMRHEQFIAERERESEKAA